MPPAKFHQRRTDIPFFFGSSGKPAPPAPRVPIGGEAENRRPFVTSLNSQRFHPPVQGAPANAQQFGGPGAVSPRHPKGLPNFPRGRFLGSVFIGRRHVFRISRSTIRFGFRVQSPVSPQRPGPVPRGKRATSVPERFPPVEPVVRVPPNARGAAIRRDLGPDRLPVSPARPPAEAWIAPRKRRLFGFRESMIRASIPKGRRHGVHVLIFSTINRQGRAR